MFHHHDDGSSTVTSLSPASASATASLSPCAWMKDLKPEERGLYLIHLLLACGNHVAARRGGGGIEHANAALDQISQLASPHGDTMQRIASYFAEALADRVLRSWPGIYKAIRSTRSPSVVNDDVLAKKLLFELFPFLKVAFLVTNQAIIEAMEGEKVVHIIDLNAAEPTQWRPLLQDLSARPEGPPHLRITAVHPNQQMLDEMSRLLTDEAEKLDIPFQFNPIASNLETLDLQHLRVKTGEAVAVACTLQLHNLLAFDDEIENLIDDSASSSRSRVQGFLSGLRGLSPKIVVITEQESNHNGRDLMQRLSESLYYYAALFDCLESTLPRTSAARLRAEKMLFGAEIKDIVACEGVERRERHEKLENWFWRLGSSGFSNVPLSYYAMLQAKRFLQSFRCSGYDIREENGCVLICWHDRALFSVSAWR